MSPESAGPESAGPARATDVVVIGGGQAGLAAGYYLRRAGLDHVVLDAADGPGGAWPHTWPSLRLFSPAASSSLPGRRMPATSGGNPDAAHVVDYLADYERRYDLPVERPVRVTSVRREGDGFAVETREGTGAAARADGPTRAGAWRCRAVISATGTATRPFVPALPGQGDFAGAQLHSATYDGPAAFAGSRVAVVGGANSGAQIAADLMEGAAEVVWCTLAPPRYLPDDVDGAELFRLATAHVRGEDPAGVASLGDIVVVPPVRAARDAGRLEARPMFARLTRTGVEWDDGASEDVDAIVWCTGFRPELRHLADLPLDRVDGVVVTDGTRVPSVPGLHLLGYGDWTGPASATLIGVGQWARAAVSDIRGRIDA